MAAKLIKFKPNYSAGINEQVFKCTHGIRDTRSCTIWKLLAADSLNGRKGCACEGREKAVPIEWATSPVNADIAYHWASCPRGIPHALNPNGHSLSVGVKAYSLTLKRQLPGVLGLPNPTQTSAALPHLAKMKTSFVIIVEDHHVYPSMPPSDTTRDQHCWRTVKLDVKRSTGCQTSFRMSSWEEKAKKTLLPGSKALTIEQISTTRR